MKFRRDEGILAPFRKYEGDAGYDLHSPLAFVLQPGDVSPRIDLGIGFAVPAGYCGFVVERSSQGKKGVHVIGPIVDSGYTGNVHVTLVNDSKEPYEVAAGDRICQMVVMAVYREPLEEVTELEGDRGDNAHGSTGR